MSEEPMTPAQRLKIAAKFTATMRARLDFAKAIENIPGFWNRDFAQRLIESDTLPPPPDAGQILWKAFDYLHNLGNTVDAAVRSYYEVGLWDTIYRRMIGPRAHYFEFSESDHKSRSQNFSVPDVCRYLGIDPNLLDTVYYDYRAEELGGTRQGLGEKLHEEIWMERRQLVTDILPFPKIIWLYDAGSSECAGSNTVPKRDSTLNLKEILSICARGKAWNLAQRAARRRKQ